MTGTATCSLSNGYEYFNSYKENDIPIHPGTLEFKHFEFLFFFWFYLCVEPFYYTIDIDIQDNEICPYGGFIIKS